jgi:hypothetical protein
MGMRWIIAHLSGVRTRDQAGEIALDDGLHESRTESDAEDLPDGSEEIRHWPSQRPRSRSLIGLPA